MDRLIDNIFENTEFPESGRELFKTVLEHKNVKIELISSNDLKDGELYNQEHDEWVLLLEGDSTLEVEGSRHMLKAGDHIFIKRSTPHRVIRTSSKTLWLAVHIY